ncbi:MAG: hypothetical protein DHS20C20_01780 [Ardenticatenaceae bacterium]|nr:MAG: hypothetical protein DHS20C20_01780 [Ardenticatenaceae bacterium]
MMAPGVSDRLSVDGIAQKFAGDMSDMKKSMSIQKFNELINNGKSEDKLMTALRQLTKVSDHKELSALRKSDVWGWDWDWGPGGR